MSTSAESPRNQAARFLAMAAEARDEGKSGVADFLTEIARRVAAAEPTLAQAVQQETVVVQQRDEHAQQTE
jgi:rubrerythrin